MNKFYSLLIMFFILLSFTPQTILAQNPGDIIIVEGNATYTFTNGTFDFENRRIVVKDNGTLIISNAIIYSKIKEREPLISAYDNAHITIINTTFIGSTYMRFYDDGVTVEIINSKSLRDFEAQKAGIGTPYYFSIGIGFGGPSVTIINSTFNSTYGTVGVWGRGAKVRIINSSLSGGFITGNSSITLINSILYSSYELSIGSTLDHPGPTNLTLSLSDGPVKYWNIYKNSTISTKPFNLTIINSTMHWAISVGSATDRKSFLKLYNSNITSLYLSNTIALIENSTIDYLDTHYLSYMESIIEILNSKIKAIKDVITLKTSLSIKNSTVGLIFTIFKPRGVIRLKGIHPGYFSYLNLGEHVEGAELNAIFNNVNITGLTINVEEATLVLDNTHINISFNSNSSIIVLPNASLSIEDFALWDSNAKIIRQTMFKVVSSNETGVKEVNISINLNNTLLREKIVANNEGLAFVNLTFTRLNFSSYNSIFEAVALKITSDNSRLYGIRKFNMMMRQPIVVEVKRQYYVKVVSDKDKVKGEGWYDEGTLAMVGVLSSTVLENTGERLVFSGWSGDINSANTTVTFIVNGPKIIYANWKKQYYVNVSSKFSSFENGNDWYDEGSYVRLKLKETSLGFFVQKVFDHFEGLSSRDRVVGNGEVEIFVDGPRTIVAVWRTTTTATVVIIAAIVVAAFITAFLLFKKRSAR